MRYLYTIPGGTKRVILVKSYASARSFLCPDKRNTSTRIQFVVMCGLSSFFPGSLSTVSAMEGAPGKLTFPTANSKITYGNQPRHSIGRDARPVPRRIPAGFTKSTIIIKI